MRTLKYHIAALLLMVCSAVNAQNAEPYLNVEVSSGVYKSYPVTENLEVSWGQILETTGKAKALINDKVVDVTWTQLWEDGPKWAEYNVGVTDGKAWSYGTWYSWGKTDVSKTTAVMDGLTILKGLDDTSIYYWGPNWRMPKKTEFDALLQKAVCTWTTKNGINGLLCTGKPGSAYANNSVFFPAAGFDNSGVGTVGSYWSADDYSGRRKYDLFFNATEKYVGNNDHYDKTHVRAVLSEENSGSATLPTVTGFATRNDGIDVQYVQLWAGGPKWASYNVGATTNKPEDYGGYYTWGGNISKDQSNYSKSGDGPLTGDDDTATKLWGSNWRMPTYAEICALVDNCDVEWITINGVSGHKYTGKVAPYNTQSIFLPATGYYDSSKNTIEWDKIYYSYYTREIKTSESKKWAWTLTYTRDKTPIPEKAWDASAPRTWGKPVRAVLAK